MSNLRLLLVTDAVGGVWVYSLELARALKPLGIDCILAVTGPSPSAERRESAASIRMIDTGLPLEWLDTTADDIARAGGELASIARRECVDVVQTCSAALLAGGDFDCPTVAVQHSCVTTWWKAVRGTPLPRDFEWRRRLVEQGLEAADAIVAPSAAFARATERAYRLDKQVLAVPNGRTPPHSPMLPQGDFALTAARLWDEGKNVATLDRAAARLDAPFQAAGPTRGPNGASVSLDHLIALGELGEAKLGGLLSARPVFASAALYEPFGLSVLEAAQAGCALVLSDIPTHRELWDGAAMFVAARDDRAFALAIDELLHDREKRRRLGDAARAHARKYTPARTARAMAQIYVRLTHGEPRLDAQLIAGAA
jgi:glycosyltransferase involved in cell wall biosynthesis